MLWVLKRDSSFEHPKHMFKLMDKKMMAILCKLFFLNWPYDSIYHMTLKSYFWFENIVLTPKYVNR